MVNLISSIEYNIIHKQVVLKIAADNCMCSCFYFQLVKVVYSVQPNSTLNYVIADFNHIYLYLSHLTYMYVSNSALIGSLLSLLVTQAIGGGINVNR